MATQEKIIAQDDTRERVALDLMRLIDDKGPTMQRSEADWLALYRRCLRCVRGMSPEE